MSFYIRGATFTVFASDDQHLMFGGGHRSKDRDVRPAMLFGRGNCISRSCNCSQCYSELRCPEYCWTFPCRSHQGWDQTEVEIFMELKDGSLGSLVQSDRFIDGWVYSSIDNSTDRVSSKKVFLTLPRISPVVTTCDALISLSLCRQQATL